MDKKYKSVLQLKQAQFENLTFKRIGAKNDSEFEVQFESNISKMECDDIYRTTLTLNGCKEGEYEVAISMTGYFTIKSSEPIDDNIRNALVSKNTVAILMPYIRSELTLLTSQPGVEPVVLPVFNINNMFEERR